MGALIPGGSQSLLQEPQSAGSQTLVSRNVESRAVGGWLLTPGEGWVTEARRALGYRVWSSFVRLAPERSDMSHGPRNLSSHLSSSSFNFRLVFGS